MKLKAPTILFLFLFLFSCKSEKPQPIGEYEVTVRMSRDPERLNPIIRSSSVAREVFSYIFLPLAEYNPENQKFESILAVDLPELERSSDGSISYTFNILPEAKWPDGQDVTAEDYLFTLKTVLHPQVNAAAWRNYLEQIERVETYDQNPKKLTIFFKEYYMLALEACGSVDIYPEHIYDPLGRMKRISIEDLKSEEIDQLVDQDTSLQKFASDFNSSRFSRDVVVGAGPYELEDWVTDQYLILKRKEDYWGSEIENRPLLECFPSKIIFKIIPDDATALTQLKSGGLDVVKGISSLNYTELKKDSLNASKLSFHAPSLMRYYYIGMNNNSPLLNDSGVRNALSRLLDIDQIIESLEYGLGTRVTGDFLPSRSYYNEDLLPINLDLEKASEFLEDSGWRDSNSNGTRDKNILGQQKELKLRMFVTGSKLGNSIALLLQENAAKVGVEIEVVQKRFAQIRRDHLNTGDFELATLVKTQSLSPNDPYQSWHTDNIEPGGTNVFGFGNAQSDDLIEQIRNTPNEEEREEYYEALQTIMYEEQPVLFLFSPKEKIVVNNKFDGLISIKRPGYFANTFKLVASPAKTK